MTDHNPISCHIPDISWVNPERAQTFSIWLASLQSRFQLQPQTLRIASADASFRRYLRINSHCEDYPTLIIMDAPPQHENCRPFVHVAHLMQKAGIRAPEIFHWDEPNGFMLLSDLGTHTILQTIHPENPDMLVAGKLFPQAVDTLIRWQLASQPDELPMFSETLLRRDLNLFPEWYIGQYRQTALTAQQQNILETSFTQIIHRNLASACVYVHRDYMPRNLMVNNAPSENFTGHQIPELGVLDFQDAVYGPITYDIASLMRDAFHSWDEEFVLDITIRYWEAARKASLPVEADFSDFWIAVEWMGLQRHLKILGIFARLTLRDGKPKYLADTPRFIHYVRTTCSRYRDLKPLLQVIDQIEKIEPQYAYSYGKG